MLIENREVLHSNFLFPDRLSIPFFRIDNSTLPSPLAANDSNLQSLLPAQLHFCFQFAIPTFKMTFRSTVVVFKRGDEQACGFKSSIFIFSSIFCLLIVNQKILGSYSTDKNGRGSYECCTERRRSSSTPTKS